ncbi:MAG TPA: glycosyl hydrolase [Candidatus Hydrogenedentes bacterium]|nr:glycosyl hydrolase [Candidatus Hydrogenedentota bacterium]HPG68309.1 glycosyl hydrolase [Candidatus Hydrogenedentota bacterium]
MTLQELFASPPSEYRQAPFWFWNHRLQTDLLDWQIEQMKEKGLGGFVMHARHGLLTPYMSDEWFECVRHCCEKARSMDMLPWAYDERDWPSGPAGGAVIADRAHRLRYLRLDHEVVAGPCTVSFESEVVAAYSAPICRDTKAETLRPEDFQRLPQGAWNAPQGTWCVLKAVRFECPPILWFESYLDTLSEEACQAFIKSTYTRYEEALGDLHHLGLAGFFTDEPALSTYPDDLQRVPWTESLPRVFQEVKEYDLLDRLPQFFARGGEGAQVRYDYWDVTTKMFERAYFVGIEAWCQTRGINFTGHPLGEEPLVFQFRCLGNIFRYLRHMDMPGMDHISGDIGGNTPLAIVPKVVSSAAMLVGHRRIMTETYGCSGWGLSLRKMKWMADWHMVQGINYFIPHAFFYTIAGRRKRDAPPSEFFQSPYWPYYRLFADYTARITALTTTGARVARIAVLYPMASVWAEFVPGKKVPAIIKSLEDGFAPLCKMLLELHRDFVIVDDDSFSHAEVSDMAFAVNGLPFEAIVVPPCTALRADVFVKLRVVASVCPTVLVGTDKVRILTAGSEGGKDVVSLAAFPKATVLPSATPETLAQALAPVHPDVELDGTPQVYVLHNRAAGYNIFFFANTADEPVSTTASVVARGCAEFWDPLSGERTPIAGQRVAGGRLRFPLALPAVGSAVVVVDPLQETPDLPCVAFEPERRIKVCDLWEFTPEGGNFLTFKDWQSAVRNRRHMAELRYKASFVVTEPIANMRLILDGIPAEPYGVAPAVIPMVGHEARAAVFIDGEPVTNALPWEIDPEFRVLDVTDRCAAGTHQLEIRVRNHGWFPQPGLEEYVWLAGDFRIEMNAGLPYLTAVRGLRSGPWEVQGYPFFSGTGTYCAMVDLDDDIGEHPIFLDAGRVGDLLDLEVNGSSVGVCPWPPYRVDVSAAVRPGRNTFVLKVTNTARNLLEGPSEENPSGLLDDVYLEIGSIRPAVSGE